MQAEKVVASKVHLFSIFKYWRNISQNGIF